MYIERLNLKNEKVHLIYIVGGVVITTNVM
jgi:hypothetical protein